MLNWSFMVLIFFTVGCVAHCPPRGDWELSDEVDGCALVCSNETNEYYDCGQ